MNGVKVMDGFKERSGLTSIAILSVDREGQWKAKEGVERPVRRLLHYLG